MRLQVMSMKWATHYLPPAPWPWKRISPQVTCAPCSLLESTRSISIFKTDISIGLPTAQSHSGTQYDYACKRLCLHRRKKNSDLKNKYVLLFFFFKEKLIFFDLNSLCFLVFCYNILLNL